LKSSRRGISRDEDELHTRTYENVDDGTPDFTRYRTLLKRAKENVINILYLGRGRKEKPRAQPRLFHAQTHGVRADKITAAGELASAAITILKLKIFSDGY
jgi:hypothetical protein